HHGRRQPRRGGGHSRSGSPVNDTGPDALTRGNKSLTRGNKYCQPGVPGQGLYPAENRFPAMPAPG
ncbi:MAG: hypothetical protein WA895_35705, partial [Streptosporangiaceae bacterium]